MLPADRPVPRLFHIMGLCGSPRALPLSQTPSDEDDDVDRTINMDPRRNSDKPSRNHYHQVKNGQI